MTPPNDSKTPTPRKRWVLSGLASALLTLLCLVFFVAFQWADIVTSYYTYTRPEFDAEVFLAIPPGTTTDELIERVGYPFEINFHANYATLFFEPAPPSLFHRAKRGTILSQERDNSFKIKKVAYSNPGKALKKGQNFHQARKKIHHFIDMQQKEYDKKRLKSKKEPYFSKRTWSQKESWYFSAGNDIRNKRFIVYIADIEDGQVKFAYRKKPKISFLEDLKKFIKSLG